jgi:NAD(P)-dependent dehydrogenase (short-subunit alcohol dehydrogenase family)
MVPGGEATGRGRARAWAPSLICGGLGLVSVFSDLPPTSCDAGSPRSEARVILVNTARINIVAPIENVADPAWDRVLAVNLTAPMILSRALAGPMKQRGWDGLSTSAPGSDGRRCRCIIARIEKAEECVERIGLEREEPRRQAIDLLEEAAQ